MKYIDENLRTQFAGKPNHPLDLKYRRPDLWTLELSCDNIDTRIPTLDIVNEVLDALEPLAAPKQLRLVHETSAEVRVSCDHDRVVQLFSNVIGNAIKFTPDGGTITVRAARQGNDVRFAVVDTGPGIPA